EHDNERVMVVLNFAAAPTAVDFSAVASAAELLCSTTMNDLAQSPSIESRSTRTRESSSGSTDEPRYADGAGQPACPAPRNHRAGVALGDGTAGCLVEDVVRGIRNLDDLAGRRRVALGGGRRNAADRVDALDEARVEKAVAAIRAGRPRCDREPQPRNSR